MAMNDKIKDGKLQYNINRQQKYQYYHQVKLININFLQKKKISSHQSKITEQANFTYTPLGKVLKIK